MSSNTLQYAAPEHYTYTHGFCQPKLDTFVEGAPVTDPVEGTSFAYPPAVPELTAIKGNEFGVFSEHTYPTLLSGTNAPNGPPKWFKKESEVDVLICGYEGGPSGLQVAMSLLRQGVSFRIIDKAEGSHLRPS
ncbi:hypothetical protein A0H81_14101 [Grifola frondosa]|uniref:Uncharacterized protein n=1 Tax=Grifola frondosa TaxID=5627 RepID=A0A1C7LSR5_GRIFR|nr:hypothetical protein A0H81_14101 [Grifola frondosa]